jgi:hypothetical protein
MYFVKRQLSSFFAGNYALEFNVCVFYLEE